MNYYPYRRLNIKDSSSIALKRLFFSILLLLLFTSCGSNSDVFAKRKYQKGRFVEVKDDYTLQKKEKEKTDDYQSSTSKNNINQAINYAQKNKTKSSKAKRIKNHLEVNPYPFTVKNSLEGTKNQTSEAEKENAINKQKDKEALSKTASITQVKRINKLSNRTAKKDDHTFAYLLTGSGLLSVLMLSSLFMIRGEEEPIPEKFPLKTLWWRILLTLILCILFLASLATISIVVGLFLFSEIFIVGIILGIGFFWIATTLAIFFGLVLWNWRNPNDKTLFKKAMLYGIIGLILPIFIYKFNIFMEWDGW